MGAQALQHGLMSIQTFPHEPFASGESCEPSLREVLASLGLETTAQERQRKRREAAARRRTAQKQAAPAPRKSRVV